MTKYKTHCIRFYKPSSNLDVKVAVYDQFRSEMSRVKAITPQKPLHSYGHHFKQNIFVYSNEI